MKIKSTNFIITTIVVLIILLLQIRILKTTSTNNNEFELIKTTIEEKYENLINNTLAVFKLKFFSLSEGYEIKNSSEYGLKFKILTKSNPLLILYFPEKMCQQCFEHHVKEFVSIADMEIYSNLAILAPVNKIRETLSTYHLAKGFNIFYIQPSIKELKNLTIPCFFTISPDLSVKNFFIPVQNDLPLTREYLQTVLEE